MRRERGPNGNGGIPRSVLQVTERGHPSWACFSLRSGVAQESVGGCRGWSAPRTWGGLQKEKRRLGGPREAVRGSEPPGRDE